MEKLDIENKRQNIRNIIHVVQLLINDMDFGIGEINYQGLIWMVATQIMDTIFVLYFLDNYKYIEGEFYWMCVDTILPEQMKDN